MTDNDTETGLAKVEQTQIAAVESMTIDDLVGQVALIQSAMGTVMKDNEHYGTIPGCGDKKVLLKAGAEKLNLLFKLNPDYEIKVADLPREHREYMITCRLSNNNGQFIGSGVGLCTTMEGKWRYRKVEKKCPQCHKAAIIKGKAEYGGGWLCWKKKGGCGATFGDNDTVITSQPDGKIEHDNPADYYNTCLKMAKKRALVDAVITRTAASDIFTQDIEDMKDNEDSGQQNTPQPSPSKPSQTSSRPPQGQDNYNRDSNPNVYSERAQAWQVMLFGHVEFPWKNDKNYDVKPIMPSNTNEKLAWAQKEANQPQRNKLHSELASKGYADDAQRRQLYQMFYKCYDLTKTDYAAVLSSKDFTAGIISCFIELAIGLIGKNEGDPVPWSANAKAVQATIEDPKPEPEQIQPTPVVNGEDIELDEDIELEEDEFL